MKLRDRISGEFLGAGTQWLHRKPHLLIALLLSAVPGFSAPSPKKVAAIVTEYRHNSHADVIVSRLFQTYTLDGKGGKPSVELASLYLDQVPESDTGRKWSKEYGIPIYPSIKEALTLGGGELAVDGVLLIAEHGDYPVNEFGSKVFPKDRFFRETEKVFRGSKRAVPVFVDKHLSTNWQGTWRSYQVSRELGFAMVAGSSLPLTWRKPPAEVQAGEKLEEIVVTTYGHPVSYGFHALEILQCLAEKRAGGETGIRRVQYLEGNAVWEAGKAGLYDRKLLEAAMERGLHRSRLYGKQPLEELVRKPFLFHVEYMDGLKGTVVNTQNAVWEWCAAWRGKCGGGEGQIRSTCFWTQENRPYAHFSYLLKGIEGTINSGEPAWPVERTLLTTGMLDAVLRSKAADGKFWETPHLGISYKAGLAWKEPPPPPPERPYNQQ